MCDADIFDSLNMRIGKNLRSARENAGLSGSDLADLLDCSSRDIAAYEAGRARLSALDLYRLSKHLSVRISCLFAETGPAVSPDADPRSGEENPFDELSVALHRNTAFRDLIEAMKMRKNSLTQSNRAA